MGLQFRKRLGDKNAWLNLTKRGITSTSVKLSKEVTYNSKRGLTVNLGGGFFWKPNKKRVAKVTAEDSAPMSDFAFTVISFIIYGIFWCFGLVVLWLIWSLF